VVIAAAGAQISAIAAAAPQTVRTPIPLVLHLVDRSRSIRLSNGRVVPRPVTTYLRWPDSGTGPWPLVVFGHGFAATPGLYADLLNAWTNAGFVVAAPVFPLGNAHAPGGPNEADLVNQPRDMSFVITELLAASASTSGAIHGLIDASHIAVAGQSDGAETAFAAAYDTPFRDRRIDAAVILAGAQLPGVPFRFPRTSPALLAVQGTADTINPPGKTYAFYRAAPRPKFLLILRNAGHITPYTIAGRTLSVVEQVTIAFLSRYLGQGPPDAIAQAAHAPGIATLTSDP
jgi:dienelactone hydrolase